jgi:hypothetical protein
MDGREKEEEGEDTCLDHFCLDPLPCLDPGLDP